MLVPLSNHVILKKEEQKNSTKSGIILTSKEQVSNEGVVESVGPEVKSEKITANGRVIFKEIKQKKFVWMTRTTTLSKTKILLPLLSKRGAEVWQKKYVFQKMPAMQWCAA
jgi:co-chaperonin GroES (HSP10)